ncbi:Translocon-associated protein subunit alpha [Trichoplax sp. H2]|nr:Translocon-associated protein subunit alpha [Trichoplax sp. H2]|eukprot:RDD46991.1 Translocon-associated protein subunit alpha [Trichoplax sp. H2]
MNTLWTKLILVVLLLAPFTCLHNSNGVNVAYAQEDSDDDATKSEGVVDDESDVEVEDDKSGQRSADSAQGGNEQEEEKAEEEAAPLIKSSEFAETNILFTTNDVQALPTGTLSKCLIGFSNIGELDFIVDSIEGSVRYPADYNYFIQNFTALHYGLLVKPRELTTFYYAFAPHDSLASRPFGLVFTVSYRDADGNTFQTVLYNDTVTFVEGKSGVDGEMVFMYVFLAACAALVVLLVRQLVVARMSKKSAKPTFETGTQNADIDMEWIPKENLVIAGGSQSPKRSPRNRKSKAESS